MMEQLRTNMATHGRSGDSDTGQGWQQPKSVPTSSGLKQRFASGQGLTQHHVSPPIPLQLPFLPMLSSNPASPLASMTSPASSSSLSAGQRTPSSLGFSPVQHDVFSFSTPPPLSDPIVGGPAGAGSIVGQQWNIFICPQTAYINLQLPFFMEVCLSPCGDVKLFNSRIGSAISLSASGQKMALDHPMGRVMHQSGTIDVQTARTQNANFGSTVSRVAKFSLRGVSFTSECSSLAYLVDEGGARSITGAFHDLYAQDIVQGVFSSNWETSVSSMEEAKSRSQVLLDNLRASMDRSPRIWDFGIVKVKQVDDGFVTVERFFDKNVVCFKSSPGNGKASFRAANFYVTASLGDEAHVYVRNHEKRLHYNGKAFIVRNMKQSAGYDETGNLRLW